MWQIARSLSFGSARPKKAGEGIQPSSARTAEFGLATFWLTAMSENSLSADINCEPTKAPAWFTSMLAKTPQLPQPHARKPSISSQQR
jgi:hypothetical protein